MSRWQERFEQHNFNKTLNEINDLLEEFSLSDNDQNKIKELERLRKVITYLNTNLSDADPELLSGALFSNMDSHLRNALANFQSFSSNEDIIYIARANDHLDNLLDIICKVFIFYGKPTKENASKIVKNYQSTFNNHLKAINFSITEKEKKLETLNSDIESAKKEFEPIKKEIEDRAGIFHAQFSKDFNVKGDKNLKALMKTRREAEEVFGAIQNTVQAGAHKQYADKERVSADRYRNSALIVMSFSILILIIPDILSLATSGLISFYKFEWSSLLARLPVSLLVFAPALYLVRESTKHRANEFYNRRQELTLKTIDSYLKLIDSKEKKDEIKASVALSIFGNNPPPNQTGDVGANFAQFFAQAKDFFKSSN